MGHLTSKEIDTRMSGEWLFIYLFIYLFCTYTFKNTFCIQKKKFLDYFAPVCLFVYLFILHLYFKNVCLAFSKKKLFLDYFAHLFIFIIYLFDT